MSLESAIYNSNVPQLLDMTPSAVCSTGKPPQIITGILLWLARRHFSEADWIVNEDLKDRVWNEDPTTSGIMIEPITKWNGAQTQTLQQRPAIYIKRNAFNTIKLGIADKYMGGGKGRVDTDAGIDHNTIDGSTMFGSMLGGSYTYFCIGNTGAAAEAVGTEMYFELLEFGPLIRQDFSFNRFQVMEMGGISKLEESDEHWVVPVTVALAAAHDWELRADLPYFKAVSLSTT